MTLDALIEYLRTEADFNRSWTDGRRGADRPKPASYVARRLELAAERDAWIGEIDRLRNALASLSLVDMVTRTRVLALCDLAVEAVYCTERNLCWSKAEQEKAFRIIAEHRKAVLRDA